MPERLLSHGVQYAGYVLQAALLTYLVGSGRWRRLQGVTLYLCLLTFADAVGRPYVLYRYGLNSQQYAYFFWLTDILLALGAFLLVCALFRRATVAEPRMWGFLRLLLASVFVLVLGISSFSLLRNYDNLFTIFIVEFQQNLYFTCLVLNTLLYILMQQIDSSDEELGLLVCGLGIQFAGPAANLALVYLTQGQQYANTMMAYVAPICTLGMLLTWFYAITRMPTTAPAPAGEQRASALAEVPVRQV